MCLMLRVMYDRSINEAEMKTIKALVQTSLAQSHQCFLDSSFLERIALSSKVFKS